MTVKNRLGALVCAAVFVAAFLGTEEAPYYLNLTGLLIVFSGTLGATLLSYPLSALHNAIRVAWNSYRSRPVTSDQVVEALLDVSMHSRKRGFLALEKIEDHTEVSFLKGALEMLVDGYSRDELVDVLTTEMRFFERRRQKHERVFRQMARLAPAFGVAGSVIGLIAMLTGIGDTSVILKTIPLALTSTLYGIVLCNFVFVPIAECIHFKTQEELLLKKLILDGVCAIREERNPRKLEKKLTSFLTPAARRGSERSFEEIRNRYRQLQLEDEPA